MPTHMVVLRTLRAVMKAVALVRVWLLGPANDEPYEKDSNVLNPCKHINESSQIRSQVKG